MIKIVSLFDNEEVGSNTAHGAGSNLLETVLRRLSVLIGEFESTLTKSMLISADMAHGIHPNYSEKHEINHSVKLNQGLVIKHNANQRYATTSITTSILKSCGKRSGSRIQEFVVRNDSPCGSTIGPMLSAKLGLRTIDVGNPQWSMHSIRETCGSRDLGNAITILKTFLEGFDEVDV
jgi:aspartyl aminopeptidase